MKKMLALLVLGSVSLVHADYYSNPSQTTQQWSGYSYGSSTQGTQDDQILTSQIQNALKSAFSNRYSNVTVTVNNGQVTLSGSVPTQADKTALDQVVRVINGVKNINNEVVVQSNPQNTQQPNLQSNQQTNPQYNYQWDNSGYYGSTNPQYQYNTTNPQIPQQNLQYNNPNSLYNTPTNPQSGYQNTWQYSN